MNKTKFLEACQLSQKTVSIPEFGDCIIREMSAGERDHFDRTLFNQETQKTDPLHYRAKLVRACLIDEETDAVMFSPEELDRVLAIKPKYIDKLYEVAEDLNKMSVSNIEEAEKN